VGADWIVGGTSLGGIVSAEIAKQTSVRQLILISSALSPAKINPVLKSLSGYAEIAPVHLIQLISGKVSLPFNDALLSMFSAAESQFIRAMCTAIFEWEGNLSPVCSVCRIHGADDSIIYPPDHDAEIIPDAGHLLALSHSRQVAEFIGDAIGLS
jgi:pimeloyl-ACP methyl ester carboxylesterase